MTDKRDVEESIRHHLRELEQSSFEGAPERWAEAVLGLGDAYMERSAGDAAENIEQAIEYYELLFKTLPPDFAPSMQRDAMKKAGRAYSERIKARRIQEGRPMRLERLGLFLPVPAEGEAEASLEPEASLSQPAPAEEALPPGTRAPPEGPRARSQVEFFGKESEIDAPFSTDPIRDVRKVSFFGKEVDASFDTDQIRDALKSMFPQIENAIPELSEGPRAGSVVQRLREQFQEALGRRERELPIRPLLDFVQVGLRLPREALTARGRSPSPAAARRRQLPKQVRQGESFSFQIALPSHLRACLVTLVLQEEHGPPQLIYPANARERTTPCLELQMDWEVEEQPGAKIFTVLFSQRPLFPEEALAGEGSSWLEQLQWEDVIDHVQHRWEVVD